MTWAFAGEHSAQFEVDVAHGIAQEPGGVDLIDLELAPADDVRIAQLDEEHPVTLRLTPTG